MTGGSNIAALKTALPAAEARAANAEAKVSDAQAEIAFLKLTIENLRREMYGWLLEAQAAAGRPVGTPARRARSWRDGGRAGGRAGGASRHDTGQRVHPQPARTQAVPRAPSARAGGGSRADGRRVLRLGEAVESTVSRQVV